MAINSLSTSFCSFLCLFSHLPALLVLINFLCFQTAGAFYCKVGFELSFQGQQLSTTATCFAVLAALAPFLSLIQRREPLDRNI